MPDHTERNRGQSLSMELGKQLGTDACTNNKPSEQRAGHAWPGLQEAHSVRCKGNKTNTILTVSSLLGCQ